MRLMIGFALTASLLVLLTSIPVARADNGGGVACASCTLIVALFEQLAVVHSEEVIEAAKKYCDTLPEPQLQRACIIFLDRYGEQIIEGFVKRQTADIICRRIGICTDATCNAFPLPPADVMALPESNIIGVYRKPIDEPEICQLPVMKEICDMINRFADGKKPLFGDTDLDDFATFPTFRGSHWRGKDCDDTKNDVYPGRRLSSYGPEIDHDCNGIYGINPETGRSYEDELCAGSDRRGLIFLGDSATAHFSIPPTYINASAINSETYDQLLLLASNELDWPHQSTGSGFLDEGNKDCPGPVDSMYKRLRERNLCNHRDFQNIGVNGARVGSMTNIVKSTNRNDTTDYPVIVMYALIGNDVCSSHNGTERMTTPDQFKTNVLTAMNYLDTILPYRSHVLFVGLIDGRVLWDIMHNEIHPINTTYAMLYDYMNCLQISPCFLWMNSNATYRDAASERAAELNEVYKQIIKEYSFNRFDMYYLDYPVFEVIDYWESQGGQAKDLIEATDGFHPSQLANALGTKIFWEKMEVELPTWLGVQNPNNAMIERLFGDQGGH